MDSDQGSIPSVEMHLRSLADDLRPILSELRSFTLGLGTNVIEQPRPHRIAYAKTLNFRVFLEVIPKDSSLQLYIRSSRSEPAAELEVKTIDQLTGAKSKIGSAYQAIH